MCVCECVCVPVKLNHTYMLPIHFNWMSGLGEIRSMRTWVQSPQNPQKAKHSCPYLIAVPPQPDIKHPWQRPAPGLPSVNRSLGKQGGPWEPAPSWGCFHTAHVCSGACARTHSYPPRLPDFHGSRRSVTFDSEDSWFFMDFFFFYSEHTFLVHIFKLHLWLCF